MSRQVQTFKPEHSIDFGVLGFLEPIVHYVATSDTDADLVRVTVPIGDQDVEVTMELLDAETDDWMELQRLTRQHVANENYPETDENYYLEQVKGRD